MVFYAPGQGDRYALHVYDLVHLFDSIERRDLDDDLTSAVMEHWDGIWWMHALEILVRIRAAVDEEIVRCISDARIDWEFDSDEYDEEMSEVPPSWEEIGRRLGVSAQAAQQRFAKRLRPHSLTGERARAPRTAPRELASRHPAHNVGARQRRRTSTAVVKAPRSPETEGAEDTYIKGESVVAEPEASKLDTLGVAHIGSQSP